MLLHLSVITVAVFAIAILALRGWKNKSATKAFQMFAMATGIWIFAVLVWLPHPLSGAAAAPFALIWLPAYFGLRRWQGY